MERKKDFKAKKSYSNSDNAKSSSRRVSNSNVSDDTSYRFNLTDDFSYYSPNKATTDVMSEEF